jgi:ABC-type bacteriocin/lantibiotic exporter with double-glycine peptidase domain
MALPHGGQSLLRKQGRLRRQAVHLRGIRLNQAHLPLLVLLDGHQVGVMHAESEHLRRCLVERLNRQRPRRRLRERQHDVGHVALDAENQQRHQHKQQQYAFPPPPGRFSPLCRNFRF